MAMATYDRRPVWKGLSMSAQKLWETFWLGPPLSRSAAGQVPTVGCKKNDRHSTAQQSFLGMLAYHAYHSRTSPYTPYTTAMAILLKRSLGRLIARWRFFQARKPKVSSRKTASCCHQWRIPKAENQTFKRSVTRGASDLD